MAAVPAYDAAVRPPVDRDRLERLLRELGRRARGPGDVFLTGGATALLHGYPALDADKLAARVMTFLDVDESG